MLGLVSCGLYLIKEITCLMDKYSIKKFPRGKFHLIKKNFIDYYLFISNKFTFQHLNYIGINFENDKKN